LTKDDEPRTPERPSYSPISNDGDELRRAPARPSTSSISAYAGEVEKGVARHLAQLLKAEVPKAMQNGISVNEHAAPAESLQRTGPPNQNMIEYLNIRRELRQLTAQRDQMNQQLGNMTSDFEMIRVISQDERGEEKEQKSWEPGDGKDESEQPQKKKRRRLK
jgi:hypothetical protein